MRRRKKPKKRHDRRRILARAKQSEITICGMQGIRRPCLRARLAA